MTSAPSARARWREGHVPGEVGVWIFVLGDMTLFAALFVAFLVERSEEPTVFVQARTTLSQPLGALNMVVLLTSSLLVVLAVHAFREQRLRRADRCLAAASVCGLVFLAVKGIEYAEKLHSGIGPGTNDYFMYFFILTGIHAVHVVLGLVVLTLVRHVVRRPSLGSNASRTIESGASFWHMVDLLWVVIFPLLYLAS